MTLDFEFWILDFGFDSGKPAFDSKSKIQNPKSICLEHCLCLY